MRTFDITVQAERRNRFDIFGWFEKVAELTAAEQLTAAHEIAKNHNAELVSYRMQGTDLIVRIRGA